MSFAGSQLSYNLSKRSSTRSEEVVCVSRDGYVFGVWHAPNGSVIFLWWIWCVRVAVWSSGAWHAPRQWIYLYPGNMLTSRPRQAGIFILSHYGCVVCSMWLFPYIHDRWWIRTDHCELFGVKLSPPLVSHISCWLERIWNESEEITGLTKRTHCIHFRKFNSQTLRSY